MNTYRKGREVRFAALSFVLIFVSLFAAAAAPKPASAATQTQLAQYRAWMADAKRLYPYPQTLERMYRVMMCESSGNRYAVGGRGLWLGLYQYAPSTWHGRWNPYRNNSIWDAKSQIYATAKAWSIGMQGAWSCYYYTRGY